MKTILKRQSKTTQSFKAAGSAATLVAIALAGMSSISSPLPAQDTAEAAIIQRGFEIAPVPLNLAGKNRDLVGLGSYIVNAVSDCNSCHNSGQPPNFDFAAGRNPYFGQTPKLDPATYMGGGQDFGPVGDPSNPGPDIITRNLTPDKTGRAEGGHTLAEFKEIIRTGRDLDHLHPTCTETVTKNCIPAPVDGSLLQIMPWPTFQNMTDRYLEAIYEYLSSIPCIAGPDDPNDPLHNDCGQGVPPPGSPVVTITMGGTVVTNQNLTVTQKFFSLDASKSTDPNGLPLSYSWTSSGPSPSLTGANTATAQVQLDGGAGGYVFTITVSDSSGATATGTVTLTYVGR